MRTSLITKILWAFSLFLTVSASVSNAQTPSGWTSYQYDKHNALISISDENNCQTKQFTVIGDYAISTIGMQGCNYYIQGKLQWPPLVDGTIPPFPAALTGSQVLLIDIASGSMVTSTTVKPDGTFILENIPGLQDYHLTIMLSGAVPDLDVADVVAIANYTNNGTPLAPHYVRMADVNRNGVVDISDAIILLDFVQNNLSQLPGAPFNLYVWPADKAFADPNNPFDPISSIEYLNLNTHLDNEVLFIIQDGNAQGQ